ncbi:stage V sporulation protein AD [Bacillus andreraoultii]|uniref:stage V sporulation protein AD n=1 Tax=Bacillus andreraoultii TaxID=1499685 RepID=UPI0005398086|nr:stage V sporulation protein AD [Bacillus andreraoultii]
MNVGKASWIFENEPVIISTGVTGGPFEKNGKLAEDFDLLHDDLWMGEDSYEKAHCLLIEEAIEIAIEKAELKKEDIKFMIGGDLINQITPTNFAARTVEIPFFGLFNACATSMEGLALSSFIIDRDGADYIITGAASHNATAERQFRYPTEYGGQKPPTAQWTVTGAGFAVIGKNVAKYEDVPRITSATIGKVIDMGLSDPFNMGGAMAPAAADTIIAHFEDTGRNFDDYDLIVTGDLGKVGRAAAIDLLHSKGVHIPEEKFQDCGLMIYSEDQEVNAGASGAASSSTVIYGHLLKQMKYGFYKKILCVATGALLSPMTVQQKETIPCIAHAVAIEMNK